MNLKMILAVFLITPALLVGCTKKEPASTTVEGVASEAVVEITAEQQAAIDAIDQPVLDENNTDVPHEVMNTEVVSVQ